MSNKVAGLWSALGEQIANRKMTEVGPVPIVPPNASLAENLKERAKAFGERLTPIFVRSAAKDPRKRTAITYPEQLLGFRPPGKWVADPEGTHRAEREREIREWRGAERRLNEDRRLRGLPPLPPRRFPRQPSP
jgi:hypothetical protein